MYQWKVPSCLLSITNVNHWTLDWMQGSHMFNYCWLNQSSYFWQHYTDVKLYCISLKRVSYIFSTPFISIRKYLILETHLNITQYSLTAPHTAVSKMAIKLNQFNTFLKLFQQKALPLQTAFILIRVYLINQKLRVLRISHLNHFIWTAETGGGTMKRLITQRRGMTDSSVWNSVSLWPEARRGQRERESSQWALRRAEK